MTVTSTVSPRPDAPAPAKPARRRRARDTQPGSAFDSRLLVAALRWATVAVGTLGALTDPEVHRNAALVAALLLVASATWRTARPLRLRRTSDTAGLLIDLALAATAVAITGGAGSPFILATLPTVLVGGQQRGYGVGFACAAGIAAVAVGASIVVGTDAWLRNSTQSVLLLATTAALGGLLQRMAASAEQEQRRALGEVTRMRDANELLLALHDVAQTLPNSLDLGQVVTSTRSRFRDLFEFEALTILVRDPATGQWRTELAEGSRIPAMVPDEELPTLLRPATVAVMATVVRDMLPLALTGCSTLGRSALVAPLRARGALVGLVSIEHAQPGRYSEHDAAILDELSEPLALAVDNAMWFGRLRTLGAEAERSRIARDLHDRTAQSLAYIAFELERIETSRNGDAEVAELRSVVRGVVTELRETLYQLRAEINDDTDLQAAAEAYVPRWSDRTGIPATFSASTNGTRLTVPVEMEVWRILQECLTNVERHSGAARVDVRWTIEHGEAVLEVRDDGKGFKAANAAKERYGLVGMRERAEAIGAHLTLDSEPGAGTRVVVEVEVPT